jgi:8-oxo-dGTP pyrophosphatase MutT (NUDIX family)
MKLNIAAAGIILKNKRILLLKRSKNTKLFPDYWGAVGGKNSK